MHVCYDGIPFSILSVDEWSREAVYTPDQTTFLYWHHTLAVTCVLNTEATAATRFPALSATSASLELSGRGPSKNRQPAGAPAVVRNTKPLEVIPRHVQKGMTREQLADADAAEAKAREARIKAFEADLKDSNDELLRDLRRQQREHEATLGAILGDPLTPASELIENNRRFADAAKAQAIAEKAMQGFGGNAGFPGLGNVGKIAKAATTELAAEKVRATLEVATRPISRPTTPTIPATDVELRARLARPRRQLLVWLNTGPGATPEYMLISPLSGCQVDARAGPICTVLEVPEVHGNMSAIMKLRFETWEAPAIQFADTLVPVDGGEGPLKKLIGVDGKLTKTVDVLLPGGRVERLEKGRTLPPGAKILTPPDRGGRRVGLAAARVITTPALMSNRWRMKAVPDKETYLMNHEVEGEAIFRLDVLQLRGLTADQLRTQICHPIPAGYVRTEVETQLSEAGDGVAYRFVDVQQLMNFPGGPLANGVIRIQVAQEVDYVGYDSVERA